MSELLEMVIEGNDEEEQDKAIRVLEIRLKQLCRFAIEKAMVHDSRDFSKFARQTFDAVMEGYTKYANQD